MNNNNKKGGGGEGTVPSNAAIIIVVVLGSMGTNNKRKRKGGLEGDRRVVLLFSIGLERMEAGCINDRAGRIIAAAACDVT